MKAADTTADFEIQRIQKFRERYRTGDVPWDHEQPPPEVIALAEELAPGQALDLGCGYGRASIYLAQRGWTVVGVDFIPEAIDGARARAGAAGVSDRVDFYVASVTRLDFLSTHQRIGPTKQLHGFDGLYGSVPHTGDQVIPGGLHGAGSFDLALDVGCMHALPYEGLIVYHQQLLRLLRAGGLFVLFAHLREEGVPSDDDEPRGIPRETLAEVFEGRGFTLASAVYGTTQVGSKPPWPSAWFRFVRDKE
jgi:SAM-dependent methyltransferase